MSRRRRGAVLIVIVVCLAVAAAVALAVVQNALAARDQLRTEEWRIQAAWLAESAMGRARARLALSPDYGGETWSLAPPESGLTEAAEVRIHVEAVPGTPGHWRVEAEADYPLHPQRRVRQRRTATFGQPSAAAGNRSRGGNQGDSYVFSADVVGADMPLLAERRTSPRPPRERFPAAAARPTSSRSSP